MSIARTDILLDNDGDFPLEDTVVNGIYLPTPYGLSDNQHVNDIIAFGKGSLKQFPTLGFCLLDWLNSEFELNSVYKVLDQNMQADGYSITKGVVVPNGDGFDIEKNYINANY